MSQVIEAQLAALAWLVPYFLIKLLLCLYEKAGCPVSLLAEVSHDEAKMRESFLPRRERPLLAGKLLRLPRSWLFKERSQQAGQS